MSPSGQAVPSQPVPCFLRVIVYASGHQGSQETGIWGEGAQGRHCLHGDPVSWCWVPHPDPRLGPLSEATHDCPQSRPDYAASSLGGGCRLSQRGHSGVGWWLSCFEQELYQQTGGLPCTSSRSCGQSCAEVVCSA